MKIKSLCCTVLAAATVVACGSQVMAAHCTYDEYKDSPEEFATEIGLGEVAHVHFDKGDTDRDLYKFIPDESVNYTVMFIGYDDVYEVRPDIHLSGYDPATKSTHHCFNYVSDHEILTTINTNFTPGVTYYASVINSQEYRENNVTDFSFVIFKTPAADKWLQFGDDWFYYSTEEEACVTGWKKINGNWYLFDYDGTMLTGWQKDGGKWYYLASSGKMQTGWLDDNGTWYFLKSDGAMASNEFCLGYWLNANGSWTYPYRSFWHQDSTGWWYGDSSGWYAKNATYVIDGKSYNFDSRGYCTNPY